jgi:hypothetical protein
MGQAESVDHGPQFFCAAADPATRHEGIDALANKHRATSVNFWGQSCLTSATHGGAPQLIGWSRGRLSRRRVRPASVG